MNPVIATAIVYIPRREKSSASIRAKIDGGPHHGLRVSCDRSTRSTWRPGQRLIVTGRVVCAGSQSAYFKAMR